MQDIIHIFSGKLRWLLFGIFTLFVPILVYSLLMPAALTSANISRNEMRVASSSSLDASDKNDRFTQGLLSMDKTISDSRSTIGRTFSSSLGFVGNCMVTVASGISRFVIGSATFLGRSVYSSAAFVGRIPGNVAKAFTTTTVVRAIITAPDETSVPKIEPIQSDTSNKQTAVLAAVVKKAESETRWPMAGRITTHFGVPHWPFQVNHTGIDISDGKGSGTTRIRPFKLGRVVKIVYSYSGLGNHVIVDHGDGLTSLYGHMHSISVKENQEVDFSTTLGYVGSTGVSTGTHLHFEIMLNGVLADPHKHIAGQP